MQAEGVTPGKADKCPEFTPAMRIVLVQEYFKYCKKALSTSRDHVSQQRLHKTMWVVPDIHIYGVFFPDYVHENLNILKILWEFFFFLIRVFCDNLFFSVLKAYVVKQDH